MGMFDELKRESERAAGEGYRQFQREAQRVMDRFVQQHKGKPVDDIKPLLRRQWRTSFGETLTEPDLTKYATAAADGQFFTVKADPFRLP